MVYDAVLVASFGGPEGPDEVMPFLEHVLAGRPVPRARMLEVAAHYQRFGGISPINAQNRALVAELRRALSARGLELPVYLGNRHAPPFFVDVLRDMQAAGVEHALAVFTSAYSSYSGCRQYREAIAAARRTLGPGAPRVDKVRSFFNHPGFVAAATEMVGAGIDALPQAARRDALVLFTAHSIPRAMAARCAYESQLREVARLVAEGVGAARWELAFQSRSGPPSQPWLEPSVEDTLARWRQAGGRHVVLAPIGFVSDHMEVVYDLDIEAGAECARLGLDVVRAPTVGVHPLFVEGLCDLVQERVDEQLDRPTVGHLPAAPDYCPAGCCRDEPREQEPTAAAGP